jgi:hypothetical protein
MSIPEYKETIKKLIDATNNEALLKHWKKQLEWDIEHEKEIELTDEEWNLVKEGIEDYRAGDTITLEEFLNKKG